MGIRLPNRSRKWIVLAAVVLIAGIAWSASDHWLPKAPERNSSEQTAAAHSVLSDGQDDHDHGNPDHGGYEELGVVHVPQQKWKSAGLKIAPVRRGSMTEVKWVTGKVGLNEDRLAHIYSLVEGIVRQVPVHYGQEVQAEQVLAVIDSRAVGEAKLELVKQRLNARFAQVNYEWNKEIHHNTQQLTTALLEKTPIPEIEKQFHDQVMGTYRQQLVSAYARLNQAIADHARLKELSEKGIASGKDYLKAKADYEATMATYHGWIEQIRFTSRRELVRTEQDLEQARTAEKVSRSLLLILGYSEEEVAQMDPLAERAGIAYYPVKAPFDGTVIAKDVVLGERVGPSTQMLEVADLSSVWVQADIFEKDLPLLERLRGKTLSFRPSGYSQQRFSARVFYTGDIVDEKTRTVRLMAVADNPQRLLKPGTFVEVELPGRTFSNVLQVPVSAVETHKGKPFVFVHQGGEEFRRRDVSIGRRTVGALEITAGLSEGERLVVKGGFALKSELLERLIGEDE